MKVGPTISPPQLYWQIEGPQSYSKLLAWWNSENTKHRYLWPGNGAHSVRKSADVGAAQRVACRRN